MNAGSNLPKKVARETRSKKGTPTVHLADLGALSAQNQGAPIFGWFFLVQKRRYIQTVEFRSDNDLSMTRYS